MSGEKKPSQTFWSSEKQKWVIKAMPENPSRTIINIDPEVLQDTILNNPTYRKFFLRLEENLEAVARGKKRTQQKEGGYIPQISALTFAAVFTILIGIQAPIFGNLRYHNPEKNSDNSTNTHRENIESAALIIPIVLLVLQALSIAALAYMVFSRKDREVKQKQLSDIMRDLLKRKPSIEAEIELKNEVVDRIQTFLGIDQIASQDFLAIENTPNAIKIGDEEAISSEVFPHGISIEMPDLEAQHIELSVLKRFASFGDLLRVALDGYNHLKVFEDIKSLMDLVETSDDRMLNSKLYKLASQLIIQKTINQQEFEISPEILDRLTHVNNFNDLINVIVGLSHDVSSSEIMKIANFTAKQVVDYLSNKEKLIALNDIDELLVKSGMNDKDHRFNLLYQIDQYFDVIFKDKSHRLKTIHNLLSKLSPEAYNELSAHIKNLVSVDNQSDILRELIDTISNQPKLNKVVENASQPSNDSAKSDAIVVTQSSKRRNQYYDEIGDIRHTAIGNFEDEEITFNIYHTKGDGNCGFYSLPIPDDKNGVKDLLLKNSGKAEIRALVAPEIIESLISNYIPSSLLKKCPELLENLTLIAAHDENQAKLLSEVLDEIDPGEKLSQRDFESIIAHLADKKEGRTPDESKYLKDLVELQEKIHAQKDQLLKLCQSEKVFKNFIEAYLGGNGRLSFTLDSESFNRSNGILDAALQLSQPPIRIVIWQMTSDSNKLKIAFDGGAKDGAITHIYHTSGKDTHFELMSDAKIGLTTTMPTDQLQTETVAKKSASAADLRLSGELSSSSSASIDEGGRNASSSASSSNTHSSSQSHNDDSSTTSRRSSRSSNTGL